jgi:hypothetical protein
MSDITFLKVGIDPGSKGKRTGFWLGYWRTPAGNFLHASTTVADTEPREVAEAHARENVPTW